MKNKLSDTWRKFFEQLAHYAGSRGVVDILREAFSDKCGLSEKCMRCVEHQVNHAYLKWLYGIDQESVFNTLINSLKECVEAASNE